MSEIDFQRAAYHESGHVVFAYLNGYSCEMVKLMQKTPGEGVSKLKYGAHQSVVTAITQSSEDWGYFKALPDQVKMTSPGVAQRLASILLAGSAAEYTFLNGGELGENMKVEISGPDLATLRSIHHFFTHLKPDHDPKYIHKKFVKVMTTMGIKEIWGAIDHLARTILDSEKKGLLAGGIHQSLEVSGFLSYLKMIM